MFRFCFIHDLFIRAVHGLQASQPKDEFRLAQAGSGKLFCSFLLFLGAVTFTVIIRILNTFSILNSSEKARLENISLHPLSGPRSSVPLFPFFSSGL
jgi:hypothetical protein